MVFVTSKSFGRRKLLLAASGVLAAPAIVRAQGQSGVALVIGNSKYKWEASLPNVKRDAPDVAKRFQAMGLKTELLQDAGGDAMRAAIERLTQASQGANLAAFYFAGHGVSWEKQTFVVPSDADLSDPTTVLTFIRVPSISAAMAGAANRLLVFDSCRNNPADGWRQREAKTLARVEAGDKVAADLSGANTVTLFSTASGAAALDGPAGENSPFAAALLRQLDTPSVDLQALPANLRRDLLIATEGRQLVWDQSSYASPFVTRGAGKSSAAASMRPDPSAIVELRNVYTFAQQSGLLLPQGLVAYRADSNPSSARMIGAFWHEMPIAINRQRAWTLQRCILIVLSTAAGSAEVVAATKDWTTGSGNRWRFVTATKTENSVSYLNIEEIARSEFVWRDQNTGQFTLSGRNAAGMPITPVSRPLTRLDG